MPPARPVSMKEEKGPKITHRFSAKKFWLVEFPFTFRASTQSIYAPSFCSLIRQLAIPQITSLDLKREKLTVPDVYWHIENHLWDSYGLGRGTVPNYTSVTILPNKLKPFGKYFTVKKIVIRSMNNL